jgi:hypothetical protein
VSSSTIHTHYLAPLDATATKRALMRAQAGLALLLAAVLALPLASANHALAFRACKAIATLSAEPHRSDLAGVRRTESLPNLHTYAVRCLLVFGAGVNDVRRGLLGVYGLTEEQLRPILIQVSQVL